MTKFLARPLAQNTPEIPAFGFGGAPIGGLFKPVAESEARETLEAALAQGVRYFDTAPFYGFGLSEHRVGNAVRGQNCAVSTKVGRLLAPGARADAETAGWHEALPFHPVYDYGYDGVMRSFEDSLQRLGLERVDILFAHDIGTMTHGADNAKHMRDLATGGVRALAELRASGRAGAIGIGVNEIAACLDALEIGEWDAFILAGRYTLLEQDALEELFPRCAARGVSVIVGGPFNSGVLVGGDTWNYTAAPAGVIERARRLDEVCRGWGVPLPAAALQFPLGHERVASVIPGLRDRRELSEALNWAEHFIPAAFWDSLKEEGLLRADAPAPAGNPFTGEAREDEG